LANAPTLFGAAFPQPSALLLKVKGRLIEDLRQISIKELIAARLIPSRVVKASTHLMIEPSVLGPIGPIPASARASYPSAAFDMKRLGD
jgi:hypothetical protein